MNTTPLLRYRLTSEDALPVEVLAGPVQKEGCEFFEFKAFPVDEHGRVCGDPTTWAKPEDFHALYRRVD
jgi:hypothetical protein